MILVLSVDFDLVVCGILFGVVGIVGQCCIILCWLIVYELVKDEIVECFKVVYFRVCIGYLLEGNLVGLLIDECSYLVMQDVLV